MTTQRKIIANRLNARASTGPKTERGKSRAIRNARRHGLSISIFSDPNRSAEIDNLALKIAGEGADPDIIERARDIARAQIDLARVRLARHDLLSRQLDDPEFRPNEFFKTAREVTKGLSHLMRDAWPGHCCSATFSAAWRSRHALETARCRKICIHFVRSQPSIACDGSLRAASTITTQICCPRF